MDWFELGPFTVFDIETTGMSPTNDRIVELAAIRINKDGSKNEFHSLINPLRSIPFSATKVHHISNDMVATAPSFDKIASDFMEFCNGSTLVAHNARFDLSFLQESLYRAGCQTWAGKTLDSIKLVKSTHPGLSSYSLQNLRVVFNLQDSSDSVAHRAFSDVEWTVQVLAIALNKALANQ